MKIKTLLSKRFFETQKIYNKLHNKQYKAIIHSILSGIPLVVISSIPLFLHIQSNFGEPNFRTVLAYLLLFMFAFPIFMMTFFSWFSLKKVNKNKLRKNKIKEYGKFNDYFSTIIYELKHLELEELLEIEDIVLNKISHFSKTDQKQILDIYEDQLDYYQNKKNNIQNKIKKHKKHNIIKEI